MVRWEAIFEQSRDNGLRHIPCADKQQLSRLQ